MPKKSVSEMNALEQLHYSLKGKTFRAIILFATIISVAAIAFGFCLYSATVRREYRTRTWQMSHTAVELLDTELLCRQAAQVAEVYDAMSEAERAQLQDKTSPLLACFDAVRGPEFDQVARMLRQIQENNGGKAAFTALLDPSSNRRIFVVDSDPNDSFCPPGSLDDMGEDVISDLINGKAELLDQFYGLGPISATLIDMEPYGYRCMAGTQVAYVGSYPVFVFFDTDMNQAASTSRSFFWQYVGLMAFITLIVLILAIHHMKRTTVAPINALAAAAEAYIADRTDEHRDNAHFAKLNIRTGDEIEKLSVVMKAMEADLADYVQNLTRITAEKERISTELSLATKIQAAMMPHIFPPFPGRDEIDIYASMDPAKEVGGDFYDFFLVDEDHLCVVMADVSGKGVPAALFMMASKIILQSCAMLGQSPAEILTKTNQAICSNNQEEMFVTAWVGILELSTGILTAANAGHEYPVLTRQPGGAFSLYKDPHGFVIGGLDGVKYREYQLQLQPGAKLFLYTDGVPEATDRNNALFGTDRMLEALNTVREGDPRQLLQTVRAAVDKFVQEAEQFDDLTMLCLEYKKRKEEQP